MRFSVVDVETANADLGSICQLGIATFENGEPVDEWTTLVDPESHFDGMNVYIHGIDEDTVRGQPVYSAIANEVRKRLEAASAVVSYGHFDRVAIGRAHTRYGLPSLSTPWLDCTRVVRRTWPDVAWRGYGLKNVCQRIGYTFKHHHALEDAKAAGRILLAAMRETGLDLEGWQKRVAQPIDPNASSDRVHLEGNPEGDLHGEVISFTGALQMVRREAATLAARIGCTVESGVTKRTTMLVVGDQDVMKLAGHEKSTKHRKAEELAAAGQRIRILRESDFMELVTTSGVFAQQSMPATLSASWD